jgi:hypothetical protein
VVFLHCRERGNPGTRENLICSTIFEGFLGKKSMSFCKDRLADDHNPGEVYHGNKTENPRFPATINSQKGVKIVYLAFQQSQNPHYAIGRKERIPPRVPHFG